MYLVDRLAEYSFLSKESKPLWFLPLAAKHCGVTRGGYSEPSTTMKKQRILTAASSIYYELFVASSAI